MPFKRKELLKHSIFLIKSYENKISEQFFFDKKKNDARILTLKGFYFDSDPPEKVDR